MGRRLDRMVTFLEAATTKSPTGNKTKNAWNELFSVAGSYQALSDGERWRAGAVEQKAEARFTVRYSARAAVILGANRLRFEGADWEITGSKETGRRRLIEITAWRVRSASEG